MQKFCKKCSKSLNIDDNMMYCPYCGNMLSDDKNKELSIELSNILSKKDPVEIHDKLIELKQKYPDNIDILKALLMQGRLHLRNPKKPDFSVIHCHLLKAYLEPNNFKASKREEMIKELFEGENLLNCLDICNDKDEFLSEYYLELCNKFCDLFITGSSIYRKSLFGIQLVKNNAKNYAYPYYYMIKNVLLDKIMPEKNKLILAKAMYNSFKFKISDDYTYLNAYFSKEELELIQP